MAEDSTRQGNFETTCRGLRPTTGHNGCLYDDDDDHCGMSVERVPLVRSLPGPFRTAYHCSIDVCWGDDGEYGCLLASDSL